MSYSNKIYELLETNKSLPAEKQVFEFGENDYEFWYLNNEKVKIPCNESVLEHLHRQWLFCKSPKQTFTQSPKLGEIITYTTGINDPLSV